MVGPWFTTPWRLVSQSHGAVAWRFRSPCPSHVQFPFASSRHRPVPSVPWTLYPVWPLCGPSNTPFPAPSPCPIIPCLYPTGSPATLWRWPTGSSSIRGPFRAPYPGSHPSCPFPLCRGPGLIPWAVVRPHPIPHPVFIPHRAASNPVARAHWILIHPGLARVAPLPPPPLTPVPPPIAHRSGGAPLRPGCSNPGRLFVVFSPLPWTLQSVAPGSPPDDPVQGLVPCFIPPLMLQSGASFYRILSVASDAPVRGTWFTPGRSSPGASAVLHSAPVAPIWGVFLSYSLRCLRCCSPWHRVLPPTIQSGGLRRAPLRPGCSNLGRLFVVFSPLPRTLQSVASSSPPDDPVGGLVPCFIPPRLLQSGASFYRILSVASNARVRGTWFTP